jgi:hypothetical protein
VSAFDFVPQITLRPRGLAGGIPLQKEGHRIAVRKSESSYQDNDGIEGGGVPAAPLDSWGYLAKIIPCPVNS